MEQNLFKYIWRHTKRDQMWILFVVLMSMPTYFLFFDLPKQIVNGPIQGAGFETPDATARFMEISFAVPQWIAQSGQLDLFAGFELGRVGYLTALSLVFLALVCINGLFKFYINTYKGRLGERTLRRLRYELIDRIMRFPSSVVRRMKPPEVATMVKDEVEPLGVFIGEAYVDPAFFSGQALVAMLFIMVQNFWLGLVAFAIVLFQAFVIPRLRRALLELGKVRQLKARALAGRVGEILEGATEVHVNDTSNYERADISNRLSRIFFLRFEFYRRKFFIKFLNNFLSQVTPFIFYFLGGYFAINGTLDLGQLVAVIAAYKDLPNPIRDLINWDQTRLDVQIKYSQVIVQFVSDDVLSEESQTPYPKDVKPLDGEIVANNVTVSDDTGAKMIEAATFKIPLRGATAVIGETNSGAEAIGEVLAKLLPPTQGHVTIGDQDLFELAEAVTGRRLGYVGPETYLRQASIRENLLYGLKHAPVADASYDDEQKIERTNKVFEAERTGNTTLDINSDWIDYDAAGLTDRSQIDDRMLEILELVDLADDIFNFGLRGLIDPAEQPELAQNIIDARNLLRENLAKSDLVNVVEPFDPDSYNSQATVAENVLFGTAIGDQFAEDKLAANDYLLSVLAQSGLDEVLFEMGRKIAETVIELFADLPPDHPFFARLSFMASDDIPEYEDVLKRIKGVGFAKVAIGDRAKLLKTSFAYIEPQHRLSLLDDKLRGRLVKARKAFSKSLPEELNDAIALYDPAHYNTKSTLQDNVLFGRISYGIAEGAQQVHDEILAVLKELGLRSAVFKVGLDFNVGIGGKQLMSLQRQKLSLARALIKRPDLLIVNKGFAELNQAKQAQNVERVLNALGEDTAGAKTGIVWVLSSPQLANRFEHVLVFEAGRLVEQGVPGELEKKGAVYPKLVAPAQ
jgi:putative ABC transport system ATP-binding protein